MITLHGPLRRRLAVTVFNFLLLALLPAALASAQQTTRPPRVRVPESADLGGWGLEIDARYNAIEKVMPVYPDEAVAKGVTGIVQVRIGVDTGGRVAKVKVRPGANPLLRRAAVIAARRWRFEPVAPHVYFPSHQYMLYRLTFQFAIEEGETRAGLHPNWRYGDSDGGYLDAATEGTKWEDATDD
jgi:TonB family protein